MNSIPLKKLGLAIGAGAVIVGAICLLTGCGGGGSSGANPTPIPTATPTPNEPPGLPPDPGEAGKVTLEGIDSNHNGLRDDVERYIAIKYQNSAKTRAVLTQYAVATQAALEDASDKTKSIHNAETTDRAIECDAYIQGSAEASAKLEKDLDSVIMNTDARATAYLNYSEQSGTQVALATPYDQRASSCSFDPSSLPN